MRSWCLASLLLVGCATSAEEARVQRDDFGVPLVTADSPRDAWRGMGRVVAEDRLWQMETARRVSRGRMAEIRGRPALASDTNAARRGYTDEELQAQFDRLPRDVRAAFTAYAEGVNDTIGARTAAGTLPPGYAELGFTPEPWTVLDSSAIAVNLLRQFGTGGGGELRNLALLQYLAGQPVRSRVLDVIDDLAWFDDPESIPTVPRDDDPLARDHWRFVPPTRAQTEAHLLGVPRPSLLELLPAVQLLDDDPTVALAEQHGVAAHWGSYAIVVGPGRSATGRAMLLTAPQMGFAIPSVVHEIALSAPGLRVAGMNVPGVPGVQIGHTPDLAWGLTSGVADLEDVYYAQLDAEGRYGYGTERRPLTVIERTIKVKDGDPVTVRVERTRYGPVLLNSAGTRSLFSLRSAFWGRELDGIAGLFQLYGAKSPADVDRAVRGIPVTFNLFFATAKGETGFRYVGQFPLRAPGFDPRFPLPSDPRAEWQGYLPYERMPRLTNPKGGLIANWNNKPAAWWPNLDTPAWGPIFRNEVLLQSLTKPKLTIGDLERAAWDIARKDTVTNGRFAAMFRTAVPADPNLRAFDGWTMDGSSSALVYGTMFNELRKALFLPTTGNFISEQVFATVIQPSVVWQAINGRTKFDFLQGRTRDELLRAAHEATERTLTSRFGPEQSAWLYRPGGIRVPEGPPVAYGDRGTYIQITDLASPPVARSVAGPGVQEVGPHAADQVPLLREWRYKPVWRFPP